MTVSDKPPFGELCGCTLIVLNTSEQNRYDWAKAEQRNPILEAAHRRGAECVPLADCEICKGWGYLPPVDAAA